MKKLLCTLGLIFSLYQVVESLAFDLIPALTSSETMAYKAGFVVGISLIFLACIGYCFWTYHLFIATPSNQTEISA